MPKLEEGPMTQKELNDSLKKEQDYEKEMNEPIKITNKEWKDYFDRDPNDPELQKWMEDKGAEFDKLVRFDVDGEIKDIFTNKDADFGVVKC